MNENENVANTLKVMEMAKPFGAAVEAELGCLGTKEDGTATAGEKFTRPEYFSRIDNNHILELHIGLDDKCRKSIELRSKFKPSHIMGTATIEVGQFVKPEYNTIRFSLKTDSMKGLFYVFCQDLIDQTNQEIEVLQQYLPKCTTKNRLSRITNTGK